MKHISKVTRSIIWVVVLILLDQGTKKLAEAYLQGKGTIPVLGDFFVLTYATNRGGFLSLGSGVQGQLWGAVFIALPLISLLLISVYILLKKREDGFYLSLWVFVFSGGIGNLIDRIFYGEVIDFLNVGFGTVRTGIFNIADIYLNVFALVVILIHMIKGDKEPEDAEADKTPESNETA